MDALAEANRQADELRTDFAQQVVDILSTVYENDPPQPNDCAGCGRSFGRNYTGACEHQAQDLGSQQLFGVTQGERPERSSTGSRG